MWDLPISLEKGVKETGYHYEVVNYTTSQSMQDQQKCCLCLVTFQNVSVVSFFEYVNQAKDAHL
jgi:hypothetical protein